MNGIRIAHWVLVNAGSPVTHLKLQKLCFYSYGVARAFDAPDLGPVPFEAWKHGPVCPEIWRVYRGSGHAPLPVPSGGSEDPFAPETEKAFRLVLAVYGRLTPSQLRNQSHLEAPWADAWRADVPAIPDDAIDSHFKRLYVEPEGGVKPPAYLFGGGSFALDGVAGPTFASLDDLAASLES